MIIPGLENLADDEDCCHVDVPADSFSGDAGEVMLRELKKHAISRLAEPIVYSDFIHLSTSPERKLVIVTAIGKKLAA